MLQQNITLKLEKSLLRKAKEYAVKDGKSLSGLMVEALNRLVGEAQAYEQARKKALISLRKGFRMGGGPYGLSRDALHDRHAP